MSRWIKSVFLIGLIVSAPSIQAEVRLAGILADHMVFQRDQKIPIWGTADPGEHISVEFSGKTRETSADSAGIAHWKQQMMSRGLGSSVLQAALVNFRQLPIFLVRRFLNS